MSITFSAAFARQKPDRLWRTLVEASSPEGSNVQHLVWMFLYASRGLVP